MPGVTPKMEHQENNSIKNWFIKLVYETKQFSKEEEKWLKNIFKIL